jgi:FlaA1/EpsC-like NDP-sugar epimerase
MMIETRKRMSVQTDIVRHWSRWLISLPRRPKRAILIANDLIAFSLALWLGYSLRLNTYYQPPNDSFLWVLLAAPLIGIATFYALGLYKLVTRFIGPGGTVRLLGASALATLLWVLFVQLSAIPGLVPRSTIILYFLLSSAFIWGSRQMAGWFLRSLPEYKPAYFDGIPTSVLIYGAGRTGVMLLDSLRYSSEYTAVGFIDENPTLWGQVVSGLRVQRPSRMKKLIERHRIEEILLTIPEASRQRQRTVIRRLQSFNVRVKTLPAMADLASGRIKVTDLRNVTADDLLGRDPVPPDPVLLARTVRGKSVLVTGAGGSIGGELARQIVKLQPRSLVLLDVSEAALYGIQRDLAEASGIAQDTQIIAVLGSVLDAGLVRRTLKLHGVQTIYHAAAYKHVPIVERNPTVGIENNTFGTIIVADAARDAGVEHFVLISTDKAVRPTNVMGASKRIAEQYLQAVARDSDEPSKTIFTMVRFGNVLDSSGSVVRLFRDQIQKGGPVTVTHADVERYFMSIPEAAELVIQAGALAKGGDVFVLEMGKPVRIADLARTMIRLMGQTVRDARNPDGDISITYTGLRDGEKLSEELLIGKETTLTAHPRIYHYHEPAPSLSDIRRELDSLRTAMNSLDLTAVQAVLLRAVEGYQPDNRTLLTTVADAGLRDGPGRRILH